LQWQADTLAMFLCWRFGLVLLPNPGGSLAELPDSYLVEGAEDDDAGSEK